MIAQVNLAVAQHSIDCSIANDVSIANIEDVIKTQREQVRSLVDSIQKSCPPFRSPDGTMVSASSRTQPLSNQLEMVKIENWIRSAEDLLFAMRGYPDSD